MHRYFIAYSISDFNGGKGVVNKFVNSILDLERPISSMDDVAIVERKLEENIGVGPNCFHKVCLLSFLPKPFE